MTNLDDKNQHHICQTQDILDDWRYELNKWTPGDLKPVYIKFTWHFLMDDLSWHISRRYFITLMLLKVLLA